MKYANPLHSSALAAYPVGSIYMSANATDPGTLFGGTWARIQGRFLLAADGNHAAGSTGGEETHTLTLNEMPQHFHTYNNGNPIVATSNSIVGSGDKACFYGDKQSIATNSAGGNQPHNNMPPYLSVYCWQRTA